MASEGSRRASEDPGGPRRASESSRRAPGSSRSAPTGTRSASESSGELRRAPEGPRRPPGGTRRVPGGLRMAPEGTRRAHECPGGPRRAPERHRRAQEGPRSAPQGTRDLPRASASPGGHRRGPGGHLTESLGELQQSPRRASGGAPRALESLQGRRRASESLGKWQLARGQARGAPKGGAHRVSVSCGSLAGCERAGCQRACQRGRRFEAVVWRLALESMQAPKPGPSHPRPARPADGACLDIRNVGNGSPHRKRQPICRHSETRLLARRSG